jgi:uncharacterized damage-inducible protein DinB
MNAADFARLYAYNDWANERMLDAISALSEEQLTRPLVSSFASIRETLDHVAFAEWLWLRRFQRESAIERPVWPSLGEIGEALRNSAVARWKFLETLDDDAIAAIVSYQSTNGDPFSATMSDILFHCANHSTYHRGQLVTLLRQVGGVPPGTDFMPFTRR